MSPSKADLHVHTKYSDRPSEWFLRRVGAPESFTDPLEVYRKCKARGMDFVTISDHNRIEGALDIADQPGTFISCEVTTYFPEDGCKMHILVTGITEGQFKVIDELRTNIYDFRQYVLDKQIIYSVAHPLYSVNNVLSVEHFEKLLVMFNRFEGINGARDPRACDLAVAVCRSLTPAMIEELADKHDIEPYGLEPWVKTFTGGSDDHGGQYIASAYTATPQAATVEAFLDNIRRGDHEMGGVGGSSVQLAHSFFHIAYSYYKSQIMGTPKGRSSVIASVLERLLHPAAVQQTPQPRGMGARLRHFVGGWITRRKVQRLSEPQRLLFDEFRHLLESNRTITGDPRQDTRTERETFQMASRISHQIGYTLVNKLIDRFTAGDLFESISTLASLGPVALGVTPYLTAMKTQHKDEILIQQVARRFNAAGDAAGHELRSDARAWVTDTFSDINGVTTTIRQIARVAKQAGKPLTVVSCVSNPMSDDAIDHRNFEPVGEFAMPEYPSQRVAFPPFLEVIEYLESKRVSEVIISTPGPMGLTALLAAKLQGLRTIGIYHTDFPRYVAELTQDENLEAATWRYMSWFYEQCDAILAPSETYRRMLMDNGFRGDKVRVFGRGVDLARFNPDYRVPGYWKRYGLGDKFTFIYVGRVSAEKNVEMLLASFMQLLARGVDAQLAVVGDGPLLASLKGRFRNPNILFTGFMGGDDLSRAYAGSDAFVFPSMTDTFGNVVLEAMASGLPAIVSDRGGPRETVGATGAGDIVDGNSPGAWVAAMERMCSNAPQRRRMQEAAVNLAKACSWEAVFDALWHHRDSTLPPVEAAGRMGLVTSISSGISR